MPTTLRPSPLLPASSPQNNPMHTTATPVASVPTSSNQSAIMHSASMQSEPVQPTQTKPKPLLTIAIPTWNRASYLIKTLDQLRLEISRLPDSAGAPQQLVEVLVSDNGSEDQTQAMIEQAMAAGLPITNIRNPANLGSDANIAQCFNRASGKYVLILGDDDLFIDHSLGHVLTRLGKKEYGIVCMRAYGFEHDFRREYPGNFGNEQEHPDSTLFLSKISALVTFISSCIINRDLLSGIDAGSYCGSNLVQVHLVIQAAIRARQNFFFNKYLIACQRNNSGGYDFSTIFVQNLGNILDSYEPAGLSREATRAVEDQLLLTFHPFYILRQRLAGVSDMSTCKRNFNDRFKGRPLYTWWVKPIITLPRPLAILWGISATVIGRTLNGDLKRGLHFALNRLKKAIRL